MAFGLPEELAQAVQEFAGGRWRRRFRAARRLEWGDAMEPRIAALLDPRHSQTE